MEASDFNETLRHRGHNLVVTHYVEDEEGKSPEQACVECHDCDKILFGVKRDDIFLTEDEGARDCVDELVEFLWPNGDEDHEWDDSAANEVANILGHWGYGPHAEKRCKHEVDPHSLSSRVDEDVVDCTCKLCGCSGSFFFENGTAEVMWSD